jgi:CubicO group peptidase (beta-lactamase class C family)
LIHAGGWDRTIKGDPINWEPQICRAMRLQPPLSPAQFIAFAQTLPLDFKPGSNAVYSNLGYIVLGEVVAKASGRAYERYVIDNILKPMGITRGQLHPRAGKYVAGEAHRHLPGSFVALPPMRLPMVDAAGGWTCSAVDMVRFLTNLDGTRGEPVLGIETRKMMIEQPAEPIKPHSDGTWFGLGWDRVMIKDKQVAAFKDGSYQGIRTYMKHLPGGLNWALLYNSSMEFDPMDMQITSGAIHEVRQLVDRMEKYPDVDLFDQFPR